MFNIVLVEPQIPQNTGNIARTCAVCNCALHLVRPLGFEIDDRKLKRAGLDYWHDLEIHYHDSFDSVAEMAAKQGSKIVMNSTHATKRYSDTSFEPGDYLVFGKETAGLGKALLAEYPDHVVRIPMGENLRSLNLSNAVAIVCYEGLRQNGFPDLK